MHTHTHTHTHIYIYIYKPLYNIKKTSILFVSELSMKKVSCKLRPCPRLRRNRMVRVEVVVVKVEVVVDVVIVLVLVLVLVRFEPARGENIAVSLK